MRIHSAILLVLTVLLTTVGFTQTAKTRIVRQDQLSIVGIEQRTSGEKEMSGEGVIPGMWQRFYGEGIIDKIPNRVDQSVYALYTDFASDRMGAYTVVIGVKVKDQSQMRDGLALKTIPAGTYAVLTSDKGPAPTVIPDAWLKIAALEDKDQLGGKRAYKCDFEVYEHMTDPQNVQADLYVGLKEEVKK